MVGKHWTLPTILLLVLGTPVHGQICGNCDQDPADQVTVLDSLLAAQIAVALVVPGTVQMALCDVDDDGDVDVLDSLFIAQVSAGLLVPLACEIPFTVDPVLSGGLGTIDGVIEGNFDNDVGGFEDIAALDIAGAQLDFYRSDGMGGFALTTSQGTGGTPAVLGRVLADCDGLIDIGYVRPSPPEVVLLLSNGVPGMFSFTTLAALPAGTDPVALTFFDADGDVEQVGEYLAIASGTTSTVTVRRQSAQGNGIYDQSATVNFAGPQVDVVFGHFNGDAFPDLAVLRTAGEVDVALGTGALSWGAAVNIGTVVAPAAMQVSDRLLLAIDLSGMGGTDLVVANGASLRLFESANGTFPGSQDFAASGTVVALQSRDMDEDAFGTDDDLDVLAAFQGAAIAGVALYLNPRLSGGVNPTPGLGASQILIQRSDGPALGVAAPDADGDGAPDTVLVGSLLAALQSPEDFVAGQDLKDVVTADMDNDGFPDVIVIDELFTGVGAVTVLLNDQAGGFLPGMQTFSLVAAGIPSRVVVGDFDDDGVNLDVAILGSNTQLEVLRNIGGGVFSPLPSHPLPVDAVSITTGDFTGTTATDIAVGCSACGEIFIYENLGMGFFARQPGITTGLVESARAIGAGDVNGDGKDEIFLVPESLPTHVQFYRNNGAGAFTFSDQVVYPAGSDITEIAVIDLDGDGMVDVAALDPALEVVHIALTASITSLASRADVPLSTNPGPLGLAGPLRLAGGRITSGSDPDLIVTTGGLGLVLLATEGNGDFTPFQRALPTGVPYGIAVTDMDQRGKDDVVTTVKFDGRIRIFRGE